MSNLREIAITSDCSGSLYTCCVWDVSTGAHLMTYRGGGAANNRTLTLRNQFIISANLTKPMLHIWPVNRQNQIQGTGFVMPGCINALVISPDGNFLVAAVAEVIYVWHIGSGKMVASISKHFQSVTSIKFIDDGSHFLTAGQDGIIFVWGLSSVLHRSDAAKLNPLYSFTDHALPIKDIHVGRGGTRSIIYSVSLDRTCKVYDLASGMGLLNLVFREPLTAVTVDQIETTIFVGTTEGSIYKFNLQSPPRMKEYQLDAEDSKEQYIGHKGAVTCLSLSIDGETMLSGGQDQNVLIWHIRSKQLIRTIPHKGAITNAFFTLCPKFMFDQEKKLSWITNNFQRMMESSDKMDKFTVDVLVSAPIRNPITEEKKKYLPSSKVENSQELEQIRTEINNLKQINASLYKMIVKNIINK